MAASREESSIELEWLGTEGGGFRDHTLAKVGLYLVKSLSSVAWGRDTSEQATAVIREMAANGLS